MCDHMVTLSMFLRQNNCIYAVKKNNAAIIHENEVKMEDMKSFDTKRPIKHTNTHTTKTSFEFGVCSSDDAAVKSQQRWLSIPCWSLMDINSSFFCLDHCQSDCKCRTGFLFPSAATSTALFPTHSPLFLSLLFNHQVPQQMAPGSTTAKLVGALLESSHTWLGQHLFMNGATITHPPTSTADCGVGGGGGAKWPKSKRRDKTQQGSDTGGASDKNTCPSRKIPYSLNH